MDAADESLPSNQSVRPEIEVGRKGGVIKFAL
jgi:hypothetical protein